MRLWCIPYSASYARCVWYRRVVVLMIEFSGNDLLSLAIAGSLLITFMARKEEMEMSRRWMLAGIGAVGFPFLVICVVGALLK